MPKWFADVAWDNNTAVRAIHASTKEIAIDELKEEGYKVLAISPGTPTDPDLMERVNAMDYKLHELKQLLEFQRSPDYHYRQYLVVRDGVAWGIIRCWWLLVVFAAVVGGLIFVVGMAVNPNSPRIVQYPNGDIRFEKPPAP